MINTRVIEKKWQKRWEEEGVFTAKNNSDKEKYYILVEFPYPSGAGLHVGHVRSYTALDAMARKTVIKQLLKYAPLSIEMQRAVSNDETVKSTISDDMSLVEDETETLEVDYEIKENN